MRGKVRLRAYQETKQVLRKYMKDLTTHSPFSCYQKDLGLGWSNIFNEREKKLIKRFKKERLIHEGKSIS